MTSLASTVDRGACFHCRTGNHEGCRLRSCSCCGTDAEDRRAVLHQKQCVQRHDEIRTAIAKLVSCRKHTKLLSWTHEARVSMYYELVQVFGPFSTWACKASRRPNIKGTWDGDFYDAWLKNYGDFMCEKQGLTDIDKSQAVEQQIAWACSTQNTMDLPDRYKIQHERNVCAAVEAGFLDAEIDHEV